MMLPLATGIAVTRSFMYSQRLEGEVLVGYRSVVTRVMYAAKFGWMKLLGWLIWLVNRVPRRASTKAWGDGAGYLHDAWWCSMDGYLYSVSTGTLCRIAWVRVVANVSVGSSVIVAMKT